LHAEVAADAAAEVVVLAEAGDMAAEAHVAAEAFPAEHVLHQARRSTAVLP